MGFLVQARIRGRALRFQGIRFNSTTSNYRLTCGLEIHAQLNTGLKLFSNSQTSFHARPNSKVSYYDAALPGTQPKFNFYALLLALRAAVALDCTVRDSFSFDRKHYFYGDQPAGYQITQHYHPYAYGGKLELFRRDGVEVDCLPVRIKQIQIEQDTGKSTYIDDVAHIDLNRTNQGLIELVTEPDIHTPEAAGVFVKKLQILLRHLGVCTGELETGAMRVDVNVNVNDGQRCEIKNLSSTSAIVGAIKAEFDRQKRIVQKGGHVEMETRGWDGTKTWKLRGKEEGVDYRYMPDPELQPIKVSSSTVEQVKSGLPELPDSIFEALLKSPYNVPLKDARTLMETELVNYYKQVYNYLEQHGSPKPQAASNWIVHRLYGELNNQDLQVIESNLPPVNVMGDIILLVQDGQKLTSSSAILLLRHIVSNPITEPIDKVIESLDLTKADQLDDIDELCAQIIDENPKVSDQVRSGRKPKSIMFLVGQVMRACQGRVDPNLVKSRIEKALGIMN
uniref:Glutamyl-tRNA(Gln) amidotransferase subunit B, mitochondrial n=1 Tax=Blastobotrys adeninivorans TaxID=409370 RepID=A0A060T4I7_BLAAD